ncbi:hypothetical protein KC334_g9549, partial [Hortaea werneckii]
MFFKRLSRSRSNSQSYVDNYANSPHDSKYNSQSYDDKYGDDAIDDRRPGSSRQSNQAPDPLMSKDGSMYARQNQPTEVAGQYGSPPMASGRQGMSNGYGGGSYDAVPASNPVKMEAAPDLLTQAFNTALKPFSDKVESLESEIMDLRAYIDQLEAQRSEVHSWIDKRGLRP